MNPCMMAPRSGSDVLVVTNLAVSPAAAISQMT
jgi:hypothetical protein